MTTRINLLPWREALRKKRERDFYGMLGAALALGAVVWFGVHSHLEGRIGYQNDRNAFIEREISRLERQIVRIRELESTKEQLIARMNVIQRLQQGRPEVVHLFEQFAVTPPEGLYLDSIKQAGANVTITGVAESNARVSNFMENLDASEWLEDPDLSVIQVEEREGTRVSNFTLTVTRQRADNARNGNGEGS